MIFEQISVGGCLSYLVGCEESSAVGFDAGMKVWRGAGYPVKVGRKPKGTPAAAGLTSVANLEQHHRQYWHLYGVQR